MKKIILLLFSLFILFGCTTEKVEEVKENIDGIYTCTLNSNDWIFEEFFTKIEDGTFYQTANSYAKDDTSYHNKYEMIHYIVNTTGDKYVLQLNDYQSEEFTIKDGAFMFTSPWGVNTCKK